MTTMRRLGQHFLTNQGIARKVVSALAPREGEAVVEIGPGHGELTALIAQKIKTGQSSVPLLFAIEKDSGLADELRDRFHGDRGIEIIHGDAREALLPLARRLETSSYKIAGNIPYYLTGRLFRMLGEIPNPPARIVLMVQKEVAERVVSAPPRMNRLAAMVQCWTSAKIAGSVPRGEFSPEPEVDSAILVLVPRKTAQISKENYFRMAKILFAQPRKTVLNNLAAAADDLETKTRDGIARALAESGIDPESRPQNLPTETIELLARVFLR